MGMLRDQHPRMLCENADPLSIFMFLMGLIPPITCYSNSTKRVIAGSSRLGPLVVSLVVSLEYNETRKFRSRLSTSESECTKLVWMQNLNRESMPSSWGLGNQRQCQVPKAETDLEAWHPVESMTSIFSNDRAI